MNVWCQKLQEKMNSFWICVRKNIRLNIRRKRFCTPLSFMVLRSIVLVLMKALLAPQITKEFKNILMI